MRMAGASQRSRAHGQAHAAWRACGWHVLRPEVCARVSASVGMYVRAVCTSTNTQGVYDMHINAKHVINDTSSLVDDMHAVQ